MQRVTSCIPVWLPEKMRSVGPHAAERNFKIGLVKGTNIYWAKACSRGTTMVGAEQKSFLNSKPLAFRKELILSMTKL